MNESSQTLFEALPLNWDENLGAWTLSLKLFVFFNGGNLYREKYLREFVLGSIEFESCKWMKKTLKPIYILPINHPKHSHIYWTQKYQTTLTFIKRTRPGSQSTPHELYWAPRLVVIVLRIKAISSSRLPIPTKPSHVHEPPSPCQVHHGLLWCLWCFGCLP